MNPEPEESENYCIVGLSPADAAVLFEALERAGIAFHVAYIEEPTNVELEGDSGQREIVVTTAACNAEAVRSIEATLFSNEP